MARVLQILCVFALVAGAFALPNVVKLDLSAEKSEAQEDSDVTTLGPQDSDSQDTRDEAEVTTTTAPEPVPQVNPAYNELRDLLTRSALDAASDNQLLEEAKKNYISAWNIEAIKQNVPFLVIEQVWPDIGSVYMPIVNQKTALVQNSQRVKEAALELKSIWEQQNPAKVSPITDEGTMYEVIANFFASVLNINVARDDFNSDTEKNTDDTSKTSEGRLSDKGPVSIQ